MNALELGPLILSGDRAAILAGVLVFLIGSGRLASRVSDRFNPWSVVVVLGGLAAARLGHVFLHRTYFVDDPLRAFVVWQGGFVWLWLAPVAALATLWVLRSGRERVWAMAPIAAGLLVATTIYQLASATEPTAPPTLTLASLDAPAINLAASSDRPTVINLWATWCPPCRREMPAFSYAEKTHPEVRFLFINQGESEAAVRVYLNRENLDLDHVLLDPTMALQRHYGTVGIPLTLFLHADGRLAKAHTGEMAPEQIAAEIARLNPPSPPKELS